MNNLSNIINKLKNSGDIYFAFLIFAIISIIIFPVPPFILDFLIVLNIVISIVVLMLSFYIPNALGLSTFPSILLITTLFRLALNIASTKQILLHAHAGQMIDAFGKIVVGGNLIVGIVVFLIITIVQFIVIVKGSERVAEVGARFTLDAMPGKQMSIDADLRAGMITKEEAKAKRLMVAQESQLHGAMDGAMKFVKGDAIAGLIISAINLLAGMAIGNLMLGMTMADAANRYSILSIGDGMISQIPSLLISISAGIIITRVSLGDENKNLSQDLTKELTAHPRAIGITCILIFAFFLIPGFPKFQILLITLLLIVITYFVVKKNTLSSTNDYYPMSSFRKDGQFSSPNLISKVTGNFSTAIHIKICENFKNKITPFTLDEKINFYKNDFSQKYGLPFPGIRMSVDPSMSSEHERLACKITFYDNAVENISFARSNYYYKPSDIIDFSLPVEQFKLDGKYCYLYSSKTKLDGCISLPLEELISYLLFYRVSRRADDLFGMQDAKNIIFSAENHIPDLASEVQRALPLQRISDILKRFVDENVSIRNISKIFENLIIWGSKEKDINLLAEYIRIDMSENIVSNYLNSDNSLNIIIFDPNTEVLLKQSVQASNFGNFISLPKDVLDNILSQIDKSIVSCHNAPIVFIVNFEIRRYLRKLIENVYPHIAVLSYQEINSNMIFNTLGVIKV